MACIVARSGKACLRGRESAGSSVTRIRGRRHNCAHGSLRSISVTKDAGKRGQGMGVFMREGSVFDRLIELASPRAWLGISVLSLVMAAASTWVLISHNGRNPTDGLYSVYDAVARFARDTIRLTFKTDRKPVAVFVAPVGILNPKATFNWVQDYLDFRPRFEELTAEPKAPVRLLDADWAPVFSDQSR